MLPGMLLFDSSGLTQKAGSGTHSSVAAVPLRAELNTTGVKCSTTNGCRSSWRQNGNDLEGAVCTACKVHSTDVPRDSMLL